MMWMVCGYCAARHTPFRVELLLSRIVTVRLLVVPQTPVGVY